MVRAQKDEVGTQEEMAGAEMMGRADCWRRERLEILVPLSFPPISSRLEELGGGAAGLERLLVTTCHGPQWLVLIWSVPDNGART